MSGAAGWSNQASVVTDYEEHAPPELEKTCREILRDVNEKVGETHGQDIADNSGLEKKDVFSTHFLGYVEFGRVQIAGNHYAIRTWSTAECRQCGTSGYLRSTFSKAKDRSRTTCSFLQRIRLEAVKIMAAERDLDFQAREVIAAFPKDMSFEKFKSNRRGVMRLQCSSDAFHAMSCAERIKNKGNDYFRQGLMDRAQHMYNASLLFVPSPTALLNLAAVMNERCDSMETLSICDRIEAMEPIMVLSSARKAKMLYRRAIALKSMAKQAHHMVSEIDKARHDMKRAVRLDPKNSNMMAELVVLKNLATLSRPELKDALEEFPSYRDHRSTSPALTETILAMKEVALLINDHQPASFPYMTEQPPQYH
ncbi:hypothetical protein C8J56DRAFT_907009 [Mycena floridula]|nr:hypothetical protein C8J56DRAFT_907009 [Mycena floridula]